MMKQVFLSTILCGFLSAIGFAQTNVAAPTAIKTTSGSYNQIVKPGTLSKKGMFSIYKTDDKYYFEIPDSLLGRQLLLTTWLVKVPGGSPKFGGEVMNNRVISFEKERGKIALKVVTILQETDSTNAITQAIKNSNVNPIAVLFDVKAQGTGGRSSIIDVTDFLQKENSFTILNSEVKRGLSIGSMAPDRSYVKSFAAYPVNVEVKMLRTYSASGGGPSGVGARPAAAPLEAAQIGGAVTLEISTSILLMPEKPMMPRRFDARVGYFADAYNEFADGQQKADTKIFIVRQRLEPKPEDIEKYKRGELVEPKEQIVYYVDPATPKQWRPYIIAGINDWNEAFKAAGFKNAIVGKEWPEDDTTMSLEDVRYRIIRYFPSDNANAYGSSTAHDPRSGEILRSYVGWYHNVMSLVHDWYMIQAGPNDPNARKMKFSDSLMGTLIRFVSSHEVGHTLGLRHNMGSSSLTPVEKLRDKNWVEAHGHTNSIMDYARFNYVAQPEDSVGEAGLMPRINDYDKWAIKWGYTWTDAKDDEADKKIVSQWIVDSLKANPRLWFGGEGMNNDARCQTEDLGDDNMKASEYGIKNLKYVMAHLTEWTKEDNDLYTNLTGVYRQVVTQYLRYAVHVTKNVASTYETWKTVEQPGNIYAPEPAAKQREAVAFLNKEVFTTPEWLLNNDILNKISNPVRSGSVGTVQARVLDQLLSDRVLNTLLMHERRYGKDSCYTMIAFLNDLKAGIWSELKTKQPIDIYRRGIQKNYISNIFAAMKEAEQGNNLIGLFMGGPTAMENTPVTMTSDIGSYLALHLEKLRGEILAAIPMAKDKDTKDHLIYVADQIKTGLKNQF